MTTAPTLSALARRVAASTCARVRGADFDDLQQVAWEAMLDASQRYDATRGDRTAYLECAARRACYLAAWRSRAQVTVRPRTGLAQEVCSLRESAVDAPARAALPAPDESPEEWAAGAQIRTLVAQRFAALASTGPHPQAVLAAVGGTAPAQVAAEHALPVQEVYRAVERLKRAARRDDTLRELHALL